MARPDRTFIKLGIGISALGLLGLLLVTIYLVGKHGWEYLQTAGWLFYLFLVPVLFFAGAFLVDTLKGGLGKLAFAACILLCFGAMYQSCGRFYQRLMEESQAAREGKPPVHLPDWSKDTRATPAPAVRVSSPIIAPTSFPTETPTITASSGPSFKLFSLQFYEAKNRPSPSVWEDDPELRTSREYNLSFSTESYYICWELLCDYQNASPEEKVWVHATWHDRTKGKEVWNEDVEVILSNNKGRFGVTACWDSAYRRGWKPGRYVLNFTAKGQYVTTNGFTVKE